MWHSMEEQNSSSLTHCFLDTNVFLHFQMFDTVDWPQALGAQHVCLMLTTTVMEELNRHKDDAKNPGRQKRAKEILSKLDDILPTDTAGISVPVRQNVTLQEILEAPDVDWKVAKLDPQKGDDYLLASILDFRAANPGASICLVTRDFPVRRKALGRNIPVVNPEGKIAPVGDLSSEAAEQRKRDRELQELKNRIPNLTIGFVDETTGKVVAHITVTESMQPNIDVIQGFFNSQFVPASVLRKRKKLADILEDRRHQIRTPGSDGIKHIREGTKDLQEYQETYEQYLVKLEAASKRNILKKYGRRCYLALALHNGGNAAATSVEFVLQFPAGSVVIRAQDEEEVLEIPKEPKPSWIEKAPSPWSSIYAPFEISHVPVSAIIKRDYAAEATYALMRSQQNWKGPFCNDTGDTHIVTYRAEELLHEKSWEMPPIIAYIWPTGSSIDYRIHAKELPRKLEGQLHIRWTST
jgi:PIN domain